MRLRTAKYVARKQVKFGLIRQDPFELIKLYKGVFKYRVVEREWYCCLHVGGEVFYRVHRCPLKLVMIMSEFVTERESYQGDVKSSEPAVDLAEYIDKFVPEDLKIDISWTRSRYPVRLRGRKRVPLDDSIEEVLMDYPEIEDSCKHYVLSNNVVDEKLLTDSLTQLIRGHEDVSVDDIVDGLLLMFAVYPPEFVENGHKQAEDYYDIPVVDTGAGALNLDPEFGLVGGSKYDLQSAASLAASLGTPLLNYEAYPKGREVLKVGKKVRQIVCEPYPVYLKAAAFSGKVVKHHGLIALGESLGVNRNDGNFLQILFKWYMDMRVLKDLTVEEFMLLLRQEGLDEDDARNWEATINRMSGWVYCLFNVARVGVAESNVDDYAQVLSHYAWPPIKYKGDSCYFATWSVGSGAFWTLDGNSKRHKVGYLLLGQRIREHGPLRVECDCFLCAEVKRDRIITEEELIKIVGGQVLGDDHIRMHVDLPVHKWKDHLLGTDTVYERKNAFYEDGNAAEYLRTSFGKRFDTYRSPGRVFGKLLKGCAREEGTNFRSACQSACLEIGPQARYLKLIEELYNLVPEDVMWDEAAQARFGNDPDEPLGCYNEEEVRLLQAGSDEPLLRVARDWYAVCLGE